jgi:hypothetical protein
MPAYQLASSAEKRNRRGSRIRQTLQHWQNDSGLADIREADAVAKLPADEREACKKLWSDVAALLKKVEEKK